MPDAASCAAAIPEWAAHPVWICFTVPPVRLHSMIPDPMLAAIDAAAAIEDESPDSSIAAATAAPRVPHIDVVCCPLSKKIELAFSMSYPAMPSRMQNSFPTAIAARVCGRWPRPPRRRRGRRERSTRSGAGPMAGGCHRSPCSARTSRSRTPRCPPERAVRRQSPWRTRPSPNAGWPCDGQRQGLGRAQDHVADRVEDRSHGVPETGRRHPRASHVSGEVGDLVEQPAPGLCASHGNGSRSRADARETPCPQRS